MFRLAVIWYLVLATVAGPAAQCCCKTKGLIDSFRTRLNPTPTRVSAIPGPWKCCDAGPTPGTSERPAQGHDPTPTGDQDIVRNLAQSGDTLPQGLYWDSPLLTSPELSLAHHQCYDPGLPFLSAQDLLRAHHQLRC